MYDKNGNLLSMDQQGNVPGSGIQTIDQLRYNYEDDGESNRLLKVGDAMPDYGTGDFVNTNGADNDYAYDANGNLASDANKSIDTIIYTHFDKPQVIRFKNGKSIEYSYNAAGSKVQELVLQPGLDPKTTDYISSYVYENNQLQYIPTAEGRSVRTTVNDDFKEEYFVKDHLGNVRSTVEVTLKPLKLYLATYELASANLEGLLFEQVAEIREDNPSSTDTGNLKSGKLNGAEQRIGTSLLMHVMADDEVELNVNTFYEGYEAQNDNPVSAANMLNSIIGTLTGGVGGFQGSEGHNPDMVQQLFTPENYLGIYDNITGNVTDPDRPKAYLNYVLFDENMAINSTFSSAFQARGNGTWEEIGTTAPLKIPANGYLAVYLSNSSQVTGCVGCGNVFFDQLQVKIQNGKLLEESHYYPFGLPMAGLSTETGSNTIRQRRKYQSNEYIKELGLNWMDFNARQYDPQLGRFLGVDPLAASGGQDMFSPYAAMGNAPESMVDPNGTSPGDYSFSPNNRQMSGMAGGNGTSYRAFIDAFGGSHSGGGMGDFGGGGGGSAWMGGHTAANGYITQIINNNNTKTTQEMIGEARRTGQTAYNFGVSILDYIRVGTDEYGNRKYLYSGTSDDGGTIGVYGKGYDPNAKEGTDWMGAAQKVNDGLGVVVGSMEKGLYYIKDATPDIKAFSLALGKFGRYLGYAGYGLIALDAYDKGLKPHHVADMAIGMGLSKVEDPRAAIGLSIGLIFIDAVFYKKTQKSATEYLVDELLFGIK